MENMEQTSELRKHVCGMMLAKWKADESTIKADIKTFHEMRERGDAEGNAYMEKTLAK
jgi:hypothetical protein